MALAHTTYHKGDWGEGEPWKGMGAYCFVEGVVFFIFVGVIITEHKVTKQWESLLEIEPSFHILLKY